MTPNEPDRDSSADAAQAEIASGASDLAAARRTLLSEGTTLHAAELRHAWLELHESWLMAKSTELGITETSGFALVGVGVLGRRELLPYSDLDLMLLHDNVSDDVLQWVADGLWYPLWDANVRLDHSVRTVSGTLGVANGDMIAALGLLDARHIAGDPALSEELIAGARGQWRTAIRSRMDGTGYVDPCFAMDSSWRSALPPESGFTYLDDVSAQVMMDLAQEGARLAKEHSSSHGPPASLLDQEVIRVSSADVSVGLPMRCVFALAAMGFLPQSRDAIDANEMIRVRTLPAWLRLDARFGSVYRRRGEAAMTLL